MADYTRVLRAAKWGSGIGRERTLIERVEMSALCQKQT
jgi:hypothetical protein